MRVAFVHDWLTVIAGAERVLEQMLLVFPQADLYSLVDFLPADQRGPIMHKQVKTSFIQKLPLSRKKYRSYLPLMPLAIEQFDVHHYDLVISSSHAVAKGVLTTPEQLHLCYCHSPMRYAWDMQHQYLRESKLDKGLKGWAAKIMLHRMRLWDQHAAHRVDHFIANSKFVAKRIQKTYRRESHIIHPPVNTHHFALHEKKESFYLTASRMVPYKKMDLIVEAFSRMPDRKLIVIGEGPDDQKIRRVARHNVTFLGYQTNSVLIEYMQKAKAFIFAAKEDFGIMPLEAQACGTPVIALGQGGLLETIMGIEELEPTGCFFRHQTIESLIEAVEKFEKLSKEISPRACRENAMRFSAERFREEFKSHVETCMHHHGSEKL